VCAAVVCRVVTCGTAGISGWYDGAAAQRERARLRVTSAAGNQDANFYQGNESCDQSITTILILSAFQKSNYSLGSKKQKVVASQVDEWRPLCFQKMRAVIIIPRTSPDAEVKTPQ